MNVTRLCELRYALQRHRGLFEAHDLFNTGIDGYDRNTFLEIRMDSTPQRGLNICMKFRLNRLTVLKSVYAGIAIAISAVYFLQTLDAVFRFIRVRSGFTSWFGTMSLIVLGIGELTFVLLTGELFRKIKTVRESTRKLLGILAVFGWLFALLQVFGIFTYVPNPALWISYVLEVWSPTEVIPFIIGASLGIGIPIYLVIDARRKID